MRISLRTGLLVGTTTAALIASLTVAGIGSAEPPSTSSQALCDLTVGSGPEQRQRAFDSAASATGVPVDVLLAVSYLESRWDDHDGAPSTSAGYGPMHLTSARLASTGKGTRGALAPEMSMQTVDLAAELTGLSPGRLVHDPTANICGGAAVLAQHQHSLGRDVGSATPVAAWAEAVARYSGATDDRSAARFVRMVFEVLHDGARRTTDDGQRVVLESHPRLRPAAAPTSTRAASDEAADCPPRLGCWWIPAPYEWYGAPSPGAYGNHDLANRQQDMDIDYIVVHDTETSFTNTLRLVLDPTYVSWQYTLRSSDGQIVNHVPADDVAWHAGNWYVNMHSIGLEHEGFAAEGAAWYTEAMYRTSAELVRYLTSKYGIPRDRAHIIGHDQVPGTVPSTVAGMHWDPGPYWDWEHYMKLIGAPIKADRRGDVWTVRPRFDRNEQPVTGCEEAGKPCESQGTNFVYVHSAPDESSPLVTDVGLHPDGSPSTTHVSDIGARVAAGQQVVVTDRQDGWARIWWLGAEGWIQDSASQRSLVRSRGSTVEPASGRTEIPVYGRAYPEESAYPDQIPYQTVTPLQYTIKAGQAYVVGDRDVETDYYYAKTYNCAQIAMDCTQVVGQDRYYQIWFGHRLAYVRAADVELVR